VAKWERLWCCPDSQEVGLEAAILERVRNSSLVEWCRADNVPGLKPRTDAAESRSDPGLVGERRVAGEAARELAVEGTRERMPA
jgi:hypothetical protein